MRSPRTLPRRHSVATMRKRTTTMNILRWWVRRWRQGWHRRGRSLAAVAEAGAEGDTAEAGGPRSQEQRPLGAKTGVVDTATGSGILAPAADAASSNASPCRRGARPGGSSARRCSVRRQWERPSWGNDNAEEEGLAAAAAAAAAPVPGSRAGLVAAAPGAPRGAAAPSSAGAGLPWRRRAQPPPPAAAAFASEPFSASPPSSSPRRRPRRDSLVRDRFRRCRPDGLSGWAAAASPSEEGWEA
mmetsp:Transcript_5544/g.16109  ORF Transcript_5544/g.16109 Transcript_5544/m.16109 type:complete len:243 (-) Transcript_5544:673-1401(-)